MREGMLFLHTDIGASNAHVTSRLGFCAAAVAQVPPWRGAKGHILLSPCTMEELFFMFVLIILSIFPDIYSVPSPSVKGDAATCHGLVQGVVERYKASLGCERIWSVPPCA